MGDVISFQKRAKIVYNGRQEAILDPESASDSSSGSVGMYMNVTVKANWIVALYEWVNVTRAVVNKSGTALYEYSPFTIYLGNKLRPGSLYRPQVGRKVADGALRLTCFHPAAPLVNHNVLPDCYWCNIILPLPKARFSLYSVIKDQHLLDGLTRDEVHLSMVHRECIISVQVEDHPRQTRPVAHIVIATD